MSKNKPPKNYTPIVFNHYTMNIDNNNNNKNSNTNDDIDYRY